MKKDKKKILFFANTSFIGGAEKNLLQIACSLKNLGHNISIAALEPGGPLISMAEQKEISTFESSFKFYIIPNYIIKIFRYLKKNKFDVVFIYGLKLRLILLPLSYLLNVPIRITMIRGIDLWKTKFHIIVERFLDKFTTIYIANSKSAIDRVIKIEHKDPNKIYLIYNGFDFNKIDFNKPENIEQSINTKFKIAILANIKPNKGHEVFLKALSILVKLERNIYVEFIGKDFSDGKVSQLINNLKPNEFVYLSGFVDDTINHLKGFDLMVLPSFEESLPTSIIEGMIAGVPVVATNIGGIPELIGHKKTGWLVEPGNSDQLKNAILYLIKDHDLRKTMSQNARENILNNFDINKIIYQYEYLIFKYL